MNLNILRGAKAADIAKRFLGVHGERFGRMAQEGQGLDSVGLIETVSIELGERVVIEPTWVDDGGALPLREIALHDTIIGDVLAFDFSKAAVGSSLRHQLGILTTGRAWEPHAQLVCVPHAVSICWLSGLWRQHLVKAYRFGVLAHEPRL